MNTELLDAVRELKRLLNTREQDPRHFEESRVRTVNLLRQGGWISTAETLVPEIPSLVLAKELLGIEWLVIHFQS